MHSGRAHAKSEAAKVSQEQTIAGCNDVWTALHCSRCRPFQVSFKNFMFYYARQQLLVVLNSPLSGFLRTVNQHAPTW